MHEYEFIKYINENLIINGLKKLLLFCTIIQNSLRIFDIKPNISNTDDR